MKDKKREEIKSVVFDIGGVLQLYKYSLFKIRRHTHKSIHEHMARKLHLSLDQWFDSIDTAYAQSIERKILKSEFLSVISKNLGINPNKLEKIWIKTCKRFFKKNRKLFAFALKLKKRGYQIAILSDQTYISKKALMPESLTKHFNPVIVSCDVGMRKPNPKIYKLILKKLKLSPKEVVFIDNQKWNLVPAKKLGMKTILFQDNNQTIKDLEKILK